jgi:hypothetical protein
MKQIDIVRSFKRKVGQKIEMEAEGLDRFIVYTPFQFEDGDHYVVILKREGNDWVLSDEGHTFMHLSYEDVDLSSGMRAQLIDQALASFSVKNDSGELRLLIPGKDYGNALFSFVQALGKIAHTALWTQDRVKSTFFEDVAEIIETTAPIGSVQQEFVDLDIDPNERYPIDFALSGKGSRKWFVFAIANDTHCQQATIACLHYENAKYPFSSMVIFEKQEKINRKYLAQLTDVTGKSFSTIGESARIKKFLETEVLNGNGKH